MANLYLDPVSGDDSGGSGTLVAPWKTITSGITAARTAPGDEIRIKKTAAAASQSVNATFTKGSTSVTLASAKWANITQCETAEAWTASANVTQSNSITRKEGSQSQQFVIAAGFSTGKVAYFDFGVGNEKNLSAYQGVSFWFHSSADLAVSMFRFDLCSDASGDSPVDSLTITQAIKDGWNAVHLKKGSALGASIRSISLIALSDPGTPTIRLDNIVAVEQIHHHSLVGRNNDIWYPVDVLASDGTTITISTAKGYREATATIDLYAIYDYILMDTETAWGTIQEGAAVGTPSKYRFGWNFSTDEQDGFTYFVGGKESGATVISASAKHYIRIERLYFHRVYYGISPGASSNGWELKDIYAGKCLYEAIDGLDSDFYKIEGKIIAVDCRTVRIGSISGQPINPGGWTAAFNIYGSPSALQGALIVSGESRITGIVTISSGQHGIQYESGVHYLRELVSDNALCHINLGIGAVAWIDKATLGYADSCVFTASSNQSSGGRIGRLTWEGTPPINFFYNMAYVGAMARFSADCIGGNADRFVGGAGFGYFGDHVTMGQAAGWAYGGTGNSLVLSPTSQASPLCYTFWVPVAATKNYKLSMQVRKTSAGANCSLVYNIVGCGITPVSNEAVTLTDSWVEHLTAAAFTTTIKGWLRVELVALDGATTGDIGIDEIRIVEV